MMTKFAFIFPGQGSQAVGMGKDAYDNYQNVKNLFLKADECLAEEFSKLIFEGPQEKLTRTYNAQPSLLITSLALLSVFREMSDLKPDYMAGHSLGEYTAYAAAGSIQYEDAVKLVRNRGLYMEQAVPSGIGTMSAVLGMDESSLEEVTKTITNQGEPVQLANLNSPGQIIISGTTDGVRLAGELAKEKGAKRVLPLEVSGPFHSSLMKPAASKLADTLNTIEIRTPDYPIVSNYTGTLAGTGEEIKDSLVKQLYSPVKWQQSVEYMIHEGVTTFIEFGPGTVLSGLVKKINRGVKVYSVKDIESCKNVVSSLDAEVKANG